MTAPIIGPLPNNILDGQPASAGPVMSNFNYIVQQVNQNAGSGGGGGGSSAGVANILYNGAMRVSQRYINSTLTLAAAAGYTLDRWQGKTGVAGSAGFSRITGISNPPFQYGCRVQRTASNAATTLIQFAQSLESNDSIPLQSQTLTLSFWARMGADYSASGATLVATVVTGTGTDENVLSGYTGTFTAITLNATLTSNWQRLQITGAIPGSATEIGVIFTYTPVGTAGTNDYFDLTGVQLEVATAATAFGFPTFADELSACSRYYQKSFPIPTQPTSAGNFIGALEYAVLVAAATQTAVSVGFTPRMRIAPQVTTYNPGAANGKWRNSTASADSGTASAAVAEWGMSLTNLQVSGDTVGQIMYIHWSADSEL